MGMGSNNNGYVLIQFTFKMSSKKGKLLIDKHRVNCYFIYFVKRNLFRCNRFIFHELIIIIRTYIILIISMNFMKHDIVYPY